MPTQNAVVNNNAADTRWCAAIAYTKRRRRAAVLCGRRLALAFAAAKHDVGFIVVIVFSTIRPERWYTESSSIVC